MNWIDYIVIALFFIIIISISIYYSKKAKKNTQEFFLSGRNLPWYLAGTAMVATTFAADTPLAVTELVAQKGIAGNWLWWNMAIGGLLTVFFFARLWRRSGVMTDIEFLEFRYSGKEASFLRGFRSIYLGLFMNVIILGWVHKAMEKIFSIIFPDFNPFLLVVLLALVIGIYAASSGLLGTIRTDSFQFIFALAGCIILAFIVIKIPEIGSIKALKDRLPPETLNFLPQINKPSGGSIANGVFAISVGAFAAYALVQWWASWYPGADPGGGGYVAQRMMSAKDEKHSLLATLWFNIAHFTLRPWPWIVVALAALVILPRAESTEALQKENAVYYSVAQKVKENQNLNTKEIKLAKNEDFNAYYEKYENTVDPGIMYPKLMLRYLPKGLLGLLIAVFLAAYMSTIAAQLNWGTSYLINDFYKRFIRKNADEKHYIVRSKISILLLVVVSLFVSKLFLNTISGAWVFILNASAGLGAVLILRWYWWRINAWSEIAAMIAPFIFYPVSRYVFNLESPITLFPTVLGSTIVWLSVTYFTPPTNEQTLNRFYKKVHPGGIGWRKFALLFPEIKQDSGYARLFMNWICGIIAIYAALYGTGQLIFANYLYGVLALVLTIVMGAIIYFNVKTANQQTNQKK